VSRRFLHFLFIGGVAFWLDAATYFLSGTLLVFLMGAGLPVVQKILGFCVGVVATYLYNSRITFSALMNIKQFFAYVCSQLIGMGVNLSVFLVARLFLPVLAALVLATLVAALVNFLGARSVLRS
jgi:putative flippase GtrA